MNFSNNNMSYLEIIVGPMFASKTTKLIEIYNQYKYCGIDPLVINHSLDDRYSNTDLVTHDGKKINCVSFVNLKSIYEFLSEDMYNNNIILINEAQFFEDLLEVVLDLLNKKNKIYIAGLDGSYERKKIGQIIDLIPYCDNITKLTAICSICRDGTRGIFSKRITNEKTEILIGSDNYIAVCRKCYENS